MERHFLAGEGNLKPPEYQTFCATVSLESSQVQGFVVALFYIHLQLCQADPVHLPPEISYLVRAQTIAFKSDIQSPTSAANLPFPRMQGCIVDLPPQKFNKCDAQADKRVMI